MKDSLLGLGGSGSPAKETRIRSTRGETFAWRAATWFGLLFTVISLADMAMVWYPLRPGNPTWEFGVIDLSFSSLPVLTLGMATLLVASLALGRNKLAAFLAVVALLGALFCIGGYLLFLSDVPLALRNSPPEFRTGVKKAIFRTTVFGVSFTTAYLVAGIATLRHLRRTKKDGSLA